MPIQIRIPSSKADRVFAHPTADFRVVPSVVIVLQPGVLIEQPAGIPKRFI